MKRRFICQKGKLKISKDRAPYIFLVFLKSFAKLRENLGQGFVMEVKIESPDKERLSALKVETWPIWTKEISRFDWYYGETEMCYFLEGRVIVELPDGQKIEIKKGDLVTFPKGLSCVWDIKEPIKKHYTFIED
jgi:uncharacterized cupin superfamily protein